MNPSPGAEGPCYVAALADTLRAHHYLGPVRRGLGRRDAAGCLVLASPTSRRLASDGAWLEFTRWCILSDEPNAGCRQWARCAGGCCANIHR